MRTQAEWNVDTHILCATGPTRRATRCFISSAALLVNVIARISNGDTPSLMSHAMRCVSTRVLPDPAPAMTSTGPSGCVTASCCAGLSPSRKSALMALQRTAEQRQQAQTRVRAFGWQHRRPEIAAGRKARRHWLPEVEAVLRDLGIEQHVEFSGLGDVPRMHETVGDTEPDDAPPGDVANRVCVALGERAGT